MRVRASNPSICTFFGPWNTGECPRAGKCEPFILSYVVIGGLETCSFEAGLSKFYFLVSRRFKVPLPTSSFQSWLQCVVCVHVWVCGYSCPRRHVWRPEDAGRCPLLSLCLTPSRQEYFNSLPFFFYYLRISHDVFWSYSFPCPSSSQILPHPPLDPTPLPVLCPY